LRIPRTLAERIAEQARQGYPFEVCGVLLGDDGTVRDVVPVVNRETESPRVRYQIAPEDLIRIQRDARDAGREIVGYYHSHPDHPARPSETDRRVAADGLSDGVIHVVVGVAEGVRTEATAWVFHDRDQAFAAEPFDII
jgi:proteasome lid subunit RPN8/RPN11